MPAQITEEILRRTISGTETVWMIQLAGSQKSVPLDPDAAEYYVNISDLRKTLIDRTTQQVNAMIDKVIAAADEMFPRAEAKLSDELQLLPNEPLSELTATVVMPDGSRAKVKIP
jgi:hypothetical protein